MSNRYIRGLITNYPTQPTSSEAIGVWTLTQQSQAKGNDNWPLLLSPGTQKAIFGYGYSTNYTAITNLVSNTGVVATDTAGVGTARFTLAAAGYGTDKAIFGYGDGTSVTNKVSNTGVVATDTTGVGTVRNGLAAAGYGTDKAIFGYGYSTDYTAITNLVSNTGVVATDTTGVGTARMYLAAAGYGTDKAIFGYGMTAGNLSMTNLVSNTGVVGNDENFMLIYTDRSWIAQVEGKKYYLLNLGEEEQAAQAI